MSPPLVIGQEPLMRHLNAQALLTLYKPLMKDLPDDKSKDMPKVKKRAQGV